MPKKWSEAWGAAAKKQQTEAVKRDELKQAEMFAETHIGKRKPKKGNTPKKEADRAANDGGGRCGCGNGANFTLAIIARRLIRTCPACGDAKDVDVQTKGGNKDGHYAGG